MRQRLGLTLKQLSVKSGIATSTLSRAENGKISLTYDKIVKLSHGLGIGMGELLGVGGSAQPAGLSMGMRSIVRAGEGRAISTPNYEHLYGAHEFVSRKMIPIIASARARSLEEFGELISHEGEEYCLVIKGVLEFHCALYEPVKLQAGDAIYFSSEMPHAYLNGGTGEAQFLCVATNPTQQMSTPASLSRKHKVALSTESGSRSGPPARSSRNRRP